MTYKDNAYLKHTIGEEVDVPGEDLTVRCQRNFGEKHACDLCYLQRLEFCDVVKCHYVSRSDKNNVFYKLVGDDKDSK